MVVEQGEGGRRRRRGRAAGRADGPPDEPKRKCCYVLTEKAHKRVVVHAAEEGIDKSELIQRLIDTHLRRYVVQDRERGRAANPDGHEDPPVETLTVGESVTAEGGSELSAGEGMGPGGGTARDRRGARRQTAADRAGGSGAAA